MSQKIGTHSGKFHCDEAFACYMLKQLPEYKDHTIVRTRDPKVLEECDIVVDVGGIYDHSKKRYDHHQKGFEETLHTLMIHNFNTKLSSAGLIYAHYGKDVIRKIVPTADKNLIDLLFFKLYENFVEAVDAIDNGISQYDGTPRYRGVGGVSSRVGFFNPKWNEPEVNADERFLEASEYVGGEFTLHVKYLANTWWPARSIIAEAVSKRFENDPSGRIVLLENGGVPWQEHFFELEREQHFSDDKVTYFVYQDTTSKNWRIQAIPVNETSGFENRLPLPASWRGLRDEALSKETGIEGCIFAHMTGFIGGNQTREGILEMARASLENEVAEIEAKRSKAN